MKWRECKNRERWYTGPSEGRTYWIARKGGVWYQVSATYERVWATSGPVVWWATCQPVAANKAFKTREAAMAYCERVAGVSK